MFENQDISGWHLGSRVNRLPPRIFIGFKDNDLHKQLYGNGADTVMYGFVAQELMQVVSEFVKEGGDGYFWYNPSGIEAILTAGVQEQQEQMASLSWRIDELENLSIPSSMSFGNIITQQSLSDRLLVILEGFGVILEQGLVKVQTLIASLIKTQELEVGSQEKPAGITIYDKATGQPVCVISENNILKSIPGKCAASVPQEGPPAATESPTSTPESVPETLVEGEISNTASGTEENVTSPQQESSVGTETPTPEPTPEQTPEVSPTPEPSPTPSETPTPEPAP